MQATSSGTIARDKQQLSSTLPHTGNQKSLTRYEYDTALYSVRASIKWYLARTQQQYVAWNSLFVLLFPCMIVSVGVPETAVWVACLGTYSST